MAAAYRCWRGEAVACITRSCLIDRCDCFAPTIGVAARRSDDGRGDAPRPRLVLERANVRTFQPSNALAVLDRPLLPGLRLAGLDDGVAAELVAQRRQHLGPERVGLA